MVKRIVYLELAHLGLLAWANESRCRASNLARQWSLPFLVVVRDFSEVNMGRRGHAAQEVRRVLHLIQVLILLEVATA